MISRNITAPSVSWLKPAATRSLNALCETLPFGVNTITGNFVIEYFDIIVVAAVELGSNFTTGSRVIPVELEYVERPAKTGSIELQTSQFGARIIVCEKETLVEIFDDNDNAEDISNRSVTLIESGTNKISAMGKKYGN